MLEEKEVIEIIRRFEAIAEMIECQNEEDTVALINRLIWAHANAEFSKEDAEACSHHECKVLRSKNKLRSILSDITKTQFAKLEGQKGSMEGTLSDALSSKKEGACLVCGGHHRGNQGG